MKRTVIVASLALLLGVLLGALGSQNVTSATSAHYVQLGWSDPGTWGKNVRIHIYRAKGAGSYGQRVLLGNTVTTWTDTNVVAGATYSYYLQACDLKTLECSDSTDPISIKIP
jgi:fibronectin type 3 domain-containing protein